MKLIASRNLFFFFWILSCPLLSQNIENSSLDLFNAVELEGTFSVKIFMSDKSRVKIEYYESEKHGVNFSNENGRLKVTKRGNSENVKINLYCSSLEEIILREQVKLSNEEALVTKNIKIKALDNSKVNLKIIANKLELKLQSKSKVVLSGATDTTIAELLDFSELNSGKMSCNDYFIEAKNSARANISVNQLLSVRTDEFATVKYYGSPSNVTILNNSKGKVEKSMNDDVPSAGNSHGDTTKLSFGKKKYIIIDEGDSDDSDEKVNDKNDARKISKRFHHWTGIDLAFNNWTDQKLNFTLDDSIEYLRLSTGFKSTTFNINLFQHNFRLYRNYITLFTGLGFGFQNYSFRNDIKLNPDSSFTYYFLETNKNFNKNKLKISYFHVPLLFEFNSSSKPSKTFHLATGFIFSFKMNSKTKRQYEINGSEFSEIRKDDYNINTYRIDATIRLGYRNFCLFTCYSLNSIFEKNRGANVHPVSFGLRLLPL